MDRRRFLQTVAASAAAVNALGAVAEPLRRPQPASRAASGTISSSEAKIEGHTLICSFTRKDETWKVYEDLRTRDGAITFVSSKGVARVLPKSAEQTFADD